MIDIFANSTFRGGDIVKSPEGISAHLGYLSIAAGIESRYLSNPDFDFCSVGFEYQSRKSFDIFEDDIGKMFKSFGIEPQFPVTVLWQVLGVVSKYTAVQFEGNFATEFNDGLNDVLICDATIKWAIHINHDGYVAAKIK